jgi:PhzF family phenazine biosynthesis protein
LKATRPPQRLSACRFDTRERNLDKADCPVPSTCIDIVDVFADRPGDGNPVAVVYGCADRDAVWKQAFTRWIGLPETVFVEHDGSPEAAYRIRIFSPRSELGFAGHPSIGALHSLRARNLAPKVYGEIIQACAIGTVTMVVEQHAGEDLISFVTPAAADVSALGSDGARRVLAALGTRDCRWSHGVDTGARWIVVSLDSATELRALVPDMAAIETLSAEWQVSGISAVAPVLDERGGFDYVVRSFGPIIGVPEDAVCGGGNACVAASISAQADFADRSATYVASQGEKLGRNGRVIVEGPLPDRRFKVGGRAHVVVSSQLTL